jgi:hypothetical protein
VTSKGPQVEAGNKRGAAVPHGGALDAVAFEGLLRVLDHLLPPGGPFPPVRQVVLDADAAVAIAAVSDEDRRALLGLLRAFRWLPRAGVFLVFALVRTLGGVPGAFGAPFRRAVFGLEGLAYTLYFSTPAVLGVLRWDADVRSVAPGDGT